VKKKAANISQELILHKMATIAAINDGQEAAINRRLKSYVHFTEVIIGELERQGKTEIFNHLPIGRQLFSDIYNIAVSSFKKGDRGAIEATMFVPTELQMLAIKHDNHSLFLRTIGFHTGFLYEAYEVTKIDVQKAIMDIAWRRLGDFANYLFSSLAKGLDQERAMQYVYGILWTFAELIKITLDHNDVEEYEKITKAFLKTFEWIEYRELETWDKEYFNNEIEKYRNIILIGLGAWIAKRNVEGTLDSDKLLKFYEPIFNRFRNIRELSEHYLLAVESETKFQWHNWILNELPEGDAHSVSYSRWLSYVYCLIGINLTPFKEVDGGDFEKLNDSDLPKMNRFLGFKFDELKKTCKEIGEQQNKWTTTIPASKLDNWEMFVELNEIAINNYEKEKLEIIIASELNGGKVNEYKSAVLKGWEENAWLDSMLMENGCVQIGEAEEGSTYAAFHMRVPKEAFMEKQDTMWVGLGLQEGRRLGLSVAENLLNELIEKGKDNIITCSLDEIGIRLDEVLKGMEEEGHKAQVLISMGDYKLQMKIGELKTFVPQWVLEQNKQKLPYYIGTLGIVPVFHKQVRGESSILILNIDKLGVYHVYQPRENRMGNLLISIKEIDEAQITQILQKVLDEKKEKGEEVKDEAEERRAIEKDVLIFIGHKSELEIKDLESIRILNVREQ